MQKNGFDMIVKLDLREEIVAPEDHDFLVLHFTGGLAARRLRDGWTLEPLPIEGKPHIIGCFKEKEFQAVVENLKIQPVIFEHQGYSGSVPHRYFRPWSYTALRQVQSPGDLWSSIASNLGPDKEREKELAQHASLGIRSLDVHMGRIASAYSSQLSGAIASGKRPNHRFAMGSASEIAASVHDFYAAIGSLRDYLAALIAARNGMPREIDDFTKLMRRFGGERVFSDEMMGVLLAGNHLTKRNGLWVAAGSLDEIRLLRRRVIHGKPYGGYEDERWGRVVEAVGGEGLPALLYEQCIVGNDGQKYELLNLVRKHYLFMMKLMEEMAKASGYSTDLPVFDESNILSIKIKRERGDQTELRS